MKCTTATPAGFFNAHTRTTSTVLHQTWDNLKTTSQVLNWTLKSFLRHASSGNGHLSQVTTQGSNWYKTFREKQWASTTNSKSKNVLNRGGKRIPSSKLPDPQTTFIKKFQAELNTAYFWRFYDPNYWSYWCNGCVVGTRQRDTKRDLNKQSLSKPQLTVIASWWIRYNRWISSPVVHPKCNYYLYITVNIVNQKMINIIILPSFCSFFFKNPKKKCPVYTTRFLTAKHTTVYHTAVSSPFIPTLDRRIAKNIRAITLIGTLLTVWTSC